jgi:hypothetical protein
MIDRLIEDERQRDRALAFLSRHRLPCRVTVSDGRSGSVEQNRLQWVWAKDAAPQRGMSMLEVQSEWKLRFGVPILLADSPDFARLWAIVGEPLPYEIRLKIMPIIAVTSKFTTMDQWKRYLDDVERDSIENGIELTNTEERKHGPKIGARVDRGDAKHGDPVVGAPSRGEASEREVRGLYAGLQREAPTPDRSSTGADKRRGK